ncbi:MAG TPA: RDD family protein [Prolixibacteraceae bacterium]|nr:RDD family protein [Prolixibacteraceae bacterium]
MDILKIDTLQNIDIEQPIASIGERIAATLLDMLFIMSYTMIVAFIAGDLHSKTLMVIALIPASLYSIVSELAMNGQSWGKKILKIKVVKTDGTVTTFSSYFLRWILRLVEILAMFGSLATITIILNHKGQRLGDIAANTTVIRLRNKSLKETIYTQIPDNYTIVFPEVSKLSANDIYTIKEVHELLKTPHKTMQVLTLAQKAHEVIEKKLGIRTVQKTEVFFQNILNDYNFINR